MDGRISQIIVVLLAVLGAGLWMSPAAAQTAIDWAPAGVNGNGVYNGTVAGVGWTLTVTNADSVTPDAGDSTLLRGQVGNPNPSATYSLVFSQPVKITWHNDASGSIGGLSGAITSNESVDLVGGVGHFSLVDNSASITAPPSNAVAPVFSANAGDLIASSQPNTDHAYYLGQSVLPRSSITWRHRNNLAKVEVWRVLVQPCLIDWSGINGNGTYNGTTAGVNWKLTVTNADAVAPNVLDSTALQGRIGMPSSLATYELQFERAVDLTWWNDASGVIGGLRGSFGWDEFVEIQGGASQFTMADNSSLIIAPPASALAPVTSAPGFIHLRADFSPGQDHAYYIARSIRPQMTFRWTHGALDSEDELWRICVEGCDQIEWDNVDSGGGAGIVGGIPWTLSVSGADAVSSIAADPTLLRGRVGNPSQQATYVLGFTLPVNLVWANAVAGSIGGLAGALGSNEMVDIVNGSGTFSLADNSANIFFPPAGSLTPQFSTAFPNDLRAGSVPGMDHAYYVGQSQSPVPSMSWEHMNVVAKNEAWWVCVACEGPPTFRPVVKVHASGDFETRLSWSSVPGASSYDVVHGDLSILRATGGDFTAATEGCIPADETANAALDPSTPAVGSGNWYLVRSKHCGGNGTYDAGLGQVGLRDIEIANAPDTCP